MCTNLEKTVVWFFDYQLKIDSDNGSIFQYLTSKQFLDNVTDGRVSCRVYILRMIITRYFVTQNV